MSLKTSLAGAVTAIGLTALAYPAQAALFSLNYTDVNGKVLTGLLTGTAAGNLITVTAATNFKYDGVSLGWDPTYVDSYAHFVDSTLSTTAQVSFDGSIMNFAAANTSDFGDQVLAFGDSALVGESGLIFTALFPGINGGEFYEETFNPSALKWSVTLVPEPGAVVALLGLGLGALASRVRKQG